MSNPLITLQIGDYFFDQVPEYTYQGSPLKTEANKVFNNRYTASFRGSLDNISDSGCTELSLKAIIEKQKEMTDDLLNCDTCHELQLQCDGSNLIHAMVSVDDLTFDESDDSWTYTSPYNLQVSWLEGNVITPSNKSCASCLTSISETWSVTQDPNVDRFVLACDNPISNFEVYTITHSISAQANNCCSNSNTGETPGYEIAKAWVQAREGLVGNESVLECLDISNDYSVCEVFKNPTLDQCGGSFSQTETYTILLGVADTTYREEWSVSESQNAEACENSYSVTGTITGCQCGTGCSKYSNAIAYWDTIKGSLPSRITCLVNPDLDCINPIPLSREVTHSPYTGTISYSYSYNDRPSLLISNAKSESITFNDTKPSETVSIIPVPGRARGPIIQSCNVYNVATRSVSINVIMDKQACGPTDENPCDRLETLYTMKPDSEVEEFLCCYEKALIADFDSVFRTQDDESWNPLTCAYSRNTTWTVSDCESTEIGETQEFGGCTPA